MDDESKEGSSEKESKPAFGTIDLRTVAIVGLFVLASIWAVDVARPVLLPLVAASLLSFLFSPLVRGLTRYHVPRAASAGVVVLLLMASLVVGIGQLWDPLDSWLDKAPTTFVEIERELRNVRTQVEKVSKATEQVEGLTKMDGEGTAAGAGRTQPSLLRRLVRRGTEAAVAIFLTLILLFFILSSDDLFLRKLVESMPRLREKRQSVEVVRTLQRDISRYLGTITLINVALGVAVALALLLLKFPNPALWGVMATLLNFVPYLGAVVGVSVVAVAGIMTFEGWGPSLTPALAYFALTSLEGYVVTPLALGRRLTLNPLAILVAVIFWGWLWGISGALLAVPLLACGTILLSRFRVLVPLAEYLKGK